MKIGFIGLGKMGYPLVLNIHEKGYHVEAFNRSSDKVNLIKAADVMGHYTLASLLSSFGNEQKILWLMVPAGHAVDEMLTAIKPSLNKGDIVIDGGNSKYQDTLIRAEALTKIGVHFVDVGTSGGVEGARNGACMMVGGDEDALNQLAPLFLDLCVPGGFLHTGVTGTGHYVKMIHNGIEYGMMQAIGEGFDILKKSEFSLDYGAIANVWSNGSIIRGLLMDLTASALVNNGPDLEEVLPIIDAQGEGQWTVEEAIRLNVSTPVIANSLFVRYHSKSSDQYGNKLVAALRNEFGGHALHKK